MEMGDGDDDEREAAADETYEGHRSSSRAGEEALKKNVFLWTADSDFVMSWALQRRPVLGGNFDGSDLFVCLLAGYI